MKYRVLTHFRLPRAQNHWLVALLAVMDAAALEIALRSAADGHAARLLLRQGVNTFADLRSSYATLAYQLT